MSSFYFDVRKDCLYCDSVDSQKRKACLFVLDLVLDRLSTYLMPILPFTVAEISALRWPNEDHDSLFVELDDYKNDTVFKQWQMIKLLRSEVLKDLEQHRNMFSSNLEAWVDLTLVNGDFDDVLDIDLAEVFIVSSVSVGQGQQSIISVSAHPGDKCDRCWQYYDQLNDGLCDRCSATES